MGVTVNGREYEWGDATFTAMGRTINISSIDYSEKANNSVVRARGNDPHSHQRTGKSYPVTLKLLQSELLAWEEAVAPRGVTDVPIDGVLTFAPEEGGKITTKTFVAFLPSDVSNTHATNTPNAGATITGESLKIL